MRKIFPCFLSLVFFFSFTSPEKAYSVLTPSNCRGVFKIDKPIDGNEMVALLKKCFQKEFPNPVNDIRIAGNAFYDLEKAQKGKYKKMTMERLFDFDSGVRGSCTFRLSLCFNVVEKRFPCDWGGTLAKVRLRNPNPLSNRQLGAKNGLALLAALEELGGVPEGKCFNTGPTRGRPCYGAAECDSAVNSGDGRCIGRTVLFNPPLTTPNVCTRPVDVIVRRGNGTGRFRVRVVVKSPVDPLTGGGPSGEHDVLGLVCAP